MKWLIAPMAGATGLFYYASQTRNHGSAWVDQVCSTTTLFCDRPILVLMLFCLVSIVAMYRMLVQAGA